MSRSQARVIGSRRVRVVKGEGTWVTVTLGVPEQVDREEWMCPFRITGLPARVESGALGADAIQSLVLAIQGIRQSLDASGWRVAWGTPGDQGGFPQFIPVFGGEEVSARIARFVDREVA